MTEQLRLLTFSISGKQTKKKRFLPVLNKWLLVVAITLFIFNERITSVFSFLFPITVEIQYRLVLVSDRQRRSSTSVPFTRARLSGEAFPSRWGLEQAQPSARGAGGGKRGPSRCPHPASRRTQAGQGGSSIRKGPIPRTTVTSHRPWSMAVSSHHSRQRRWSVPPSQRESRALRDSWFYVCGRVPASPGVSVNCIVLNCVRWDQHLNPGKANSPPQCGGTDIRHRPVLGEAWIEQKAKGGRRN